MTASMARGQICPAHRATDCPPYDESVPSHLAPLALPPKRYHQKDSPGPDVFASYSYILGRADRTGAMLRADRLDGQLLAQLQAGDLPAVARAAGQLERARPNAESLAQARALRDARRLPAPRLEDVERLFVVEAGAASFPNDGTRLERLDLLLAFDELAAWAQFTRAPRSLLSALWEVAAFLILEAGRVPWLWLDLVLEARRVLAFSSPRDGDASLRVWTTLASLATDAELDGLAELHGDPDLSKVRPPQPQDIQIDFAVEDVPSLPAIVGDPPARDTAPNRPIWLRPRETERPRDPERTTKSACGEIGGERRGAAVLPC